MWHKKPQDLYSLILLIVPFLILAPVIFTVKALFWGTPGLQFIPWQAYAWETLLGGEMPLWKPWLVWERP